MTREEAKILLPIIQAFAEGKTIQIRKHGEESYYDTTNSKLNFDLGYYSYRVKSETKCRPFKNADECWQEMLKHQPFGWLKHKDEDELYYILKITDSRISMIDICEEVAFYDYNETFKQYTFADGAPFVVKEEVWEN